jgi:acyl-homoserine-lactone acylase
MKKLFPALLILILPALTFAQKFIPQEVARYKQQAKAVTIVRDNWGVPHIYAQTDAQVVFGLMYTQCEDNFKGIERNYLYQLAGKPR